MCGHRPLKRTPHIIILNAIGLGVTLLHTTNIKASLLTRWKGLSYYIK